MDFSSIIFLVPGDINYNRGKSVLVVLGESCFWVSLPVTGEDSEQCLLPGSLRAQHVSATCMEK